MIPRVIPVLQISDGYLVKTSKFKRPLYVGDPINAVKIFNEKQVDELVVVDIDASKRGAITNLSALEEFASEAFMPVAYGGGISNVEDATRVLAVGVEKVILGSAVANDPLLVRRIADAVGSQSVVVSVDVKRDPLGRRHVYTNGSRRKTGSTPSPWAEMAVHNGAGELLVSSITRDGTGGGYDLEVVKEIAESNDVPVIALGGAGSLDDVEAVIRSGASAAAAGSFFVLNGKHKAVLITYPSPAALRDLAARLQN